MFTTSSRVSFPSTSSRTCSRGPTTTSGSAACGRWARSCSRTSAASPRSRSAGRPSSSSPRLNRYFDETSDAILEHGGTLVAYRGDGFLAVFGAPIEIEDHADRALATAREMVDVRLPRFNAWLRENGFGEEVRMGVGLNTGPFMSGNVGSLRRLEYTVHGDTVNTASRIEGMTKTIGGPILLPSRPVWRCSATRRPPARRGVQRCAAGNPQSACGRWASGRHTLHR